jgi:hypothetical protein
MFSSDGFCYFIIFIEVHTKHIWYNSLVEKSNMYSTFHHFQVFIELYFFYVKLNLFKLFGMVNNVS